MSAQTTLRDVKRRTMQLMNYEDGLWDLLLGIIFVLLAVYPITRALLGPAWNLTLFLALLALLVGGQSLARRLFSAPRLGYARSRRSPALKLLLIVTIILVLVTVGLVVLTLTHAGWLPNLSLPSGPAWLREYSVDIVVMLLLIGLFSVMGYLFGVARLYLYGWLLGTGNLASTMLSREGQNTLNAPLAVAAGIIIVIGLALLVRFVRRYPIRVEEA